MIRILHVLDALDRGSVGAWLMNVLRRVERTQFAMDVLLRTTQPCPYEAELLGLGVRLYSAANPWEVLRVLRRHGPYDIVHSHCGLDAAWVLKVAQFAGVPSRVAHSHGVEKARWFGSGARFWIQRHATARLAASEQAAESLFGEGWRHGFGTNIAPRGVDLDAFLRPVDAAEVRRSLSLSVFDRVIGHVGPLARGGNYEFVLRVASRMMAMDPRFRLLLVGEGPLRGQIDAQARRFGIRDRVLFAGASDRLPELMLGAMDVLLAPSGNEDVAVAAQAAGLPALVSHRLPTPAVWRPELVQPLKVKSPQKWAEEAVAASECRQSPRTAKCPFSMGSSINQLLTLYRSQFSADFFFGTLYPGPAMAARNG